VSDFPLVGSERCVFARSPFNAASTGYA